MSYGSLQNQMMANSQNPAPKVGDGCTILYWTDRQAATIIAVDPNGRWVDVQEDHARRLTPTLSDSQQWELTRNPNGRAERFTLRKNGKWCPKGAGMNGTRLLIGPRFHYHDDGF